MWQWRGCGWLIIVLCVYRKGVKNCDAASQPVVIEDIMIDDIGSAMYDNVGSYKCVAK